MWIQKWGQVSINAVRGKSCPSRLWLVLPSPRYDPEFGLLFARLVTHCWRNAAFLEADQLLRNAATLNGIPGVLIHGRFDVSGPLETVWRLSTRWATSRLHVVEDAGHGGGGVGAAITAALAEFSEK